MAHEIEQPIDRVFSIQGTEWHGLAEHVESITDEIIRPICPKIISGPMALDMGLAAPTIEELRSRVHKAFQMKPENEDPNVFAQRMIATVKNLCAMPAHQGLAADYRGVREDLNDHETQGLVALHVPKNSYQPISNGELWDAAKGAIEGIGAKVSCVGTLKAGKVFFVSVQLNEDGGKFTVKRANGEGFDDFFANLNIIGSHDGTLGVKAYDSTVRIVCMNTLRWSLEAAGDVNFTVYHTKNAPTAMTNLPALVNAILSGRAQFRDSMEYLATQAISATDARLLVTGYFVRGFLANAHTEKDAYQIATRTRNAIEEISTLFHRGKGNLGKSLYDLLNGVTEYYTTGEGTGKGETDKAARLCKANFGKAADHKTAFCNLLMSGADTLKEAIEQGKRAESESAE